MISPSIISPILRVTTPILLCALGGVYSERSGTGNITYEGSMLMATFTGVVGSYFTGSALVGVLCAMLGGVLVNLFYGLLRLRMGGDNVVCGFAVNSFCVGATTYLLRTLFQTSGTLSDPKIQGLYKVRVPILKDIPVVKYFFTNQTLLVYLAFILVVVTTIVLKRTKFGMNIRACGENPMAAAAVGVNVTRTSYYYRHALRTGWSADVVGKSDSVFWKHGRRAGIYRSCRRYPIQSDASRRYVYGSTIWFCGSLSESSSVDNNLFLFSFDDSLYSSNFNFDFAAGENERAKNEMENLSK